MTAACAGTTKKGRRCTMPAARGSEYCYLHDPDPAVAARRSRNASRAATLGNSKIGAEIRSTRLLVRELVEMTVSNELHPLVRKRLAEVVQLLQVYARLAELEMRAAEEPIEANLDVKGLKAQVLRRIEELEELEREREELLAEVMAVAQDHGLDTWTLKAVIGR